METKKLTTKEAWQLIANAFAGKLTPDQQELIAGLEFPDDFTGYGLCSAVADLERLEVIASRQHNWMLDQIADYMNLNDYIGYLAPCRVGLHIDGHVPEVHDKLRAELAQKFADEA